MRTGKKSTDERGKMEVKMDKSMKYMTFARINLIRMQILWILSYSYSTDIYQIEFCYLTSFSVNIDIAVTFIIDFCLFYCMNVSPGMLLVIMAENAPAPAVRLSIKKAPAKNPESLMTSAALLPWIQHPSWNSRRKSSFQHFIYIEMRICLLPVFLITVSALPFLES